MLLVACSDPGPMVGDATADDARVDASDDGGVTFRDHTVRRVETPAEFAVLATRDHGVASTKLVITDFGNAALRDLVFYDAGFYTLHDEWYWFRLLNGAPVPGDRGVAPVRGLSFPTIRAVYDWAQRQATLPLDLMIGGGRLYSWRFYDLAFGPARIRGLATLMHIEARTAPAPSPERWAFELEYSDVVTHAELVVFFETISAHLGPELARDLRFIVRSAEHEALAQRMERERLPYWDRILRYRDIVNPGAREVYSDGVAAGSLRFIRAGERFDDTTPEDILVFEQTPDLLPPAAGVVTAQPQTPLAHINLLARNRGIPNAHIANVLDDPELDQLARGWARVVYLTESPSRVVIAAITNEQYLRYRALASRPIRVVATPPVDALPYVVDLSAHALSERTSLIPTLGGKSTGMLALLADPDITHPDHPQGISVRAYVEHVTPLRPRIEAALRVPRFDADARVRHVAVEGIDAFLSRNPDAPSRAFVDALLRDNPVGTTFGDLARGGGVRGIIERTPIAPATITAITSALASAYRDLAPTQGIRFRSSSNVEDVEGFNGAGLYESYTGFLDAASQPDVNNRSKTVERALQKVWGSFWAFEAFEERRIEGIDHLSAAMAVMAHPRFDDPLERATGVCTFTRMPPNSPDDARLEVNTQPLDLSVANPDPTLLPEVVVVSRARSTGALRIERVRRATMSPDADLLDDATLRRLFDDTGRVTDAWLANDNSARAEARRGRTLTLDLEFHDMRAGWPAMRDGSVRPARLVLKQSRSLEPGLRVPAMDASAWPMPRDILVRVRRVGVDTCSADLPGGGHLRASALRALTDASLIPDVGFSETPFEASLTVAVEGADLPALGWARDAQYSADHTGFTVTREGGVVTWTPRAGTPAAQGFERLQLAADGRATLSRGALRYETTLQCVSELRYASPRDYLLSLVPR